MGLRFSSAFWYQGGETDERSQNSRQIRNQLAEKVLKSGNDIPRFEPMPISPWLAMSALQKSIRRRREDLALRSAATLLRDTPDRLRRRLGVTAFEDVGVANFEVVSLVVAGLSGRTWRAKNGGSGLSEATSSSGCVRPPSAEVSTIWPTFPNYTLILNRPG